MQRFIWIHYWPAFSGEPSILMTFWGTPPRKDQQNWCKSRGIPMHVEKCLAIFMCMFSVHVMSHQICLHVCKRMYIYICHVWTIQNPTTIHHVQFTKRISSSPQSHHTTSIKKQLLHIQTTHITYIYIYTYISHYPLLHPSTMFPNKIPPRFCIRSGKGGEGEIHTERTR